jgi:hypothetical protein
MWDFTSNTVGPGRIGLSRILFLLLIRQSQKATNASANVVAKSHNGWEADQESNTRA